MAVAGCAPETARPDAGATMGTDSGMMMTTSDCADGVRNGDETDVDCGGSCGAGCAVGAGCAEGADCDAGVCGIRLRCLSPSCMDRVRNGTETDADCGGPDCPACMNTRMCAMDSDCDSMRCVANICESPACADGLQNGEETDIDCGGSMCSGCPGGGMCFLASDCDSLFCDMGTCTMPRCDDMLRNGLETGVDCGGVMCSACGDGLGCAVPSDCTSGVCGADMLCAAPACDDMVHNGDEVDVDCGGSCPLCPPGATCTSGADCDSAVCDMGECTTAACDDGIQNGGEADVDCGGMTTCPRCPDYDACTDPSDCVSAMCTMGLCGTGCMPFSGSSMDTFGYFGCSIMPSTLPCPDISGSGTNASLTDDSNRNVSIGFSFDFYGMSYTTLDIQSNGGVSFTPGYMTLSNACLPTSSGRPPQILTMWDDLNPSGGGQVLYQTMGTAPNRQFVVRWDTARFGAGSNRAVFTLVLDETSNDIQVCYIDTSFANATYDRGASATIGIDRGATDALQFSCNTASLSDGLFIRYIHP